MPEPKLLDNIFKIAVIVGVAVLLLLYIQRPKYQFAYNDYVLLRCDTSSGEVKEVVGFINQPKALDASGKTVEPSTSSIQRNKY